VLLPVGGVEDAGRIAHQLLAVLEEPFVLDGHQLGVGASIGIALGPEHGRDADTLLRRADVAMYVAKRARSGYVVYAAEQDQFSPDRLALIVELRRAIEHNELTLHFQPKVDLEGCLAGVEALVRWPHPQRGVIPPDQFIPLAEHTGLIKPLTRWVLRAALGQCHAWLAAGHEIPVAVNVSMHDLHDTGLLQMIAGLLTSRGVPARCLRLEVTEGRSWPMPGGRWTCSSASSRSGWA
jgi:predicted signal transduction protein with EAL and GGDEF domain